MRVQRTPRFRTAARAAACSVVVAVLLAVGPVSAQQAPAPAEAGKGPAADLPRRYKELEFPPLRSFSPAQPTRHVLSNGIVVFLLEDHELPTIDLSGRLKVGEVYEPRELAGLAQICGEVMRSGGTASMPGDALDEELERRAMTVETSIGTEDGTVSLSVLREDFDHGLEVLSAVLREPAFPQEKIDLVRKELLSSIERRNDDTDEVASREFGNVLYGRDAPWTREVDPRTLRRITRDDLVAFHGRYVTPRNLILGVWGDFQSEAMLALLEKRLGGWKGEVPDFPPDPILDIHEGPWVGYVDRPDVNQSTVHIGHYGVVRKPKDPDYPALLVMNDILGGGGFSSRLLQNVRTEKGLAYSIYSYFTAATRYPGSFRAVLQTKSESTVAAIRAVKAEIERIRREPVTAEELRVAKESFLNSLVFSFDSNGEIVSRQLFYEAEGWPTDHLQWLQDAVARVTAEDVLRVAGKYLHPDALKVLVVGHVEDFDGPLSAVAPEGVQPVAVDTTLVPYEVPGEASGPTAPEATQERLDRGRALADRAVQAAGGAQAVQAVTSYVLEGAAKLHTPQGDLSLGLKQSVRLPDRFRMELATPMGRFLEVLNGDAGWSSTPQGVSDASPEEVAELRGRVGEGYLGLLAELAAGRMQPVHESTTEDGEEVVRVETASGETLRLRFDGATGHLVARQQDGPMGDEELIFSEFREVGALRFPWLQVTLVEGQNVQGITVEELTINPVLGDELFGKP